MEIARPERIIGKNTAESIKSGIYYGYVGLVDNIVEDEGRDGWRQDFHRGHGSLAPFMQRSQNIDAVDLMLT